jgi:hypothetical protein
MKKSIPKFASNAIYRREMIEKLSIFLEKMNLEWKQKEHLLTQQTHTSFQTIQETGQIVYFDLTTKQKITPQEYAKRYLQIYPSTTIKKTTTKNHSYLPPQEEKEEKDNTSITDSTICTTGNRMIGSSTTGSSIDNTTGSTRSTDKTTMLPKLSKDSEWVMEMLSSIGLFIKKDTNVFIPVVSSNSLLFDQFFLDEMQLELKNIESKEEMEQWMTLKQVMTQLINNKQEQQELKEQRQCYPHKSNRRKSILQPNQKELETFHEKILEEKEKESSNNLKKRACIETQQKSHRRQKRRQSIVGQVILPSFTQEVKEEEEEKKEEKEDSAIGVFESIEEDTTTTSSSSSSNMICQLCFSEMANVSLRPCGHSMCSTCWKRLEQLSTVEASNTNMMSTNTSSSTTSNNTNSSNRSSSNSSSSSSSSSSYGVLCPWDRELVMDRILTS